MGEWHAEVPASAVISLLPRLHETTPPPAELPLAPRPPRRTRRLVVALVGLVALTCLAGVAALWLSDSPGTWFNLIFTVMGLVLGLGLIAAAASWYQAAGEEDQAWRDWRARPPSFPEGGVVVDRKVGFQSESGAVNQIQLLVQVGDQQVTAGWRSGGRGSLLQSQVPGIGSRARVWRSSAGPVLIEVADPSVVEGQDAR